MLNINLKIGDRIDLAEITRFPEGENLDYKSQYPTVNSDLIHDVLCLSNSIINSDRLLVFGINDDRSVSGVENDPNRKNQADLINLFRTSRLNKLQSFFLVTENYNDHEIDILVIKNMPEKPYFLTEDYTSSGRPLRAGTVYSRVGDTNTPVNSCSSDHIVEKMYMERIGLDKSPLDRFHIYLKQKELWKYGYNNDGLYFYHTMFPEFTIQETGDREHNQYVEPWCLEFPDQNASRTDFFIKFHNTVLGNLYLIWIDGARFKRVQPRQKIINDSGIYFQSFYYVEESIEYLANEMILEAYPDLEHRSFYDEFFIVFSSDEKANEEIERSYHAQDGQYVIYSFDKAEDDYVRIDSRGRRRLFWRR